MSRNAQRASAIGTGGHSWWQFSRCENSARVTAGGTNRHKCRTGKTVAPLHAALLLAERAVPPVDRHFQSRLHGTDSRRLFRHRGTVFLCVLGAVFTGLGSDRAAAASFTTLGSETPRAEIVIVEDDYATDAFKPRSERIHAMINRGITNLTGKLTPREAWLSLVTTQDIVGIKVYSNPGPNSGTRPAVAAAVAQGLIAAGLPPRQIIVWDKLESDLRAAGYFELQAQLGIRVAASATAGYDETNYYETSLIGNLVFGDLEFGKTGEGIGKKSFVSKLMARELTKIINLTPLLNHNDAGVCGNLYNLALGSVDNTLRFEGDPQRLATAVPEIYALPALYDRTVLNIVDALICQYEGGQRGLLHYSVVLNQLRFSRDPVALDMLSIKELDRQRRNARAPNVRPNLELYRNATLLELGVSDLPKMQIETLR